MVLDYELLQSQTNFTFRADTTYLVTGTVNLSGTTTLEGGAVVKFAPQDSAVRINYSGPLICQTGPYRPAIFTARDDNTVGEVVPGSTGAPTNWYGYFGLYANGSGQTIQVQHVRFNYLHCPVGFSGGTGHSVRHARIVNAKYGVYAISQTTPVTVANALFHTLGTGGQVFYGSGTPTIVAEHVTVRNAVSLHNGVNLTLRNSLLAGVTTVPTYTGDHTTQLASDTGVFASVGAGANYLAAGSPYRAAGTEAINATLLAELRAWGTTREPAVWTTAITADTVWEPLVERSAGLPDLGYHYPALDYAVSGVSLTNATLTLTNGVAVAVYGTSGLTITGAGKLRGEGTPGLLNRLVRHSAVHEQWLPVWAGGTSGTLLKDDASGQSASEVRLRFTECVVPAAGGHHFNGGARLGRLALTDCELHGGSLNFNAAGTYARVVALTNNVLNRVPFSLGTGSDTTLTTYARNNLFRGITSGSLNAASGNAWEWRDNLFDTASLWQYFGGVANGNNAYRNCPRQLTPAGSGNLTLTALSYTADAWGRGRYASTTPSLLNAGSRTASTAGLYHYTTETSQAKEQSTQVDIGFHYVVASTSTGRPADTDEEGLPDYFEDANGDGVFQVTETNPASQDSDGDGISDAAEVAYGLNPSNPDTDGNGIPDGQQHVNTFWYSPGETKLVYTPSVWEWPVSRLGELTLLLAQGTQRARVEVLLSSTEDNCAASHLPPHWDHTGDAVRWAVDYPKSPSNLKGNTTVQQNLNCLQCGSPSSGNCPLFDQWLDVSEATAEAASFIRVRLAATKGTDCFDRYSSIFVRVTALKLMLSFQPCQPGGFGSRQIDPPDLSEAVCAMSPRIGVVVGDSVDFYASPASGSAPPESAYLWTGTPLPTGSSQRVQFSTPGNSVVEVSVYSCSPLKAHITCVVVPAPNEATWLQDASLFLRAIFYSSGLSATTWAQQQCSHLDVHNCRADAVRHAYWAGLILLQASEATALAATTAHERTNIEGGGRHNECVMDIENNHFGISFAKQVSSGLPLNEQYDVLRSILTSAANAGTLTVLDQLTNEGELGYLVPSCEQPY